jgi:hypothetical protein
MSNALPISEVDWKALFLQAAEMLNDYQWHHDEQGNCCYECGANATGSNIPKHAEHCKLLRLLIIADTTKTLDYLTDTFQERHTQSNSNAAKTENNS